MVRAVRIDLGAWGHGIDNNKKRWNSDLDTDGRERWKLVYSLLYM